MKKIGLWMAALVAVTVGGVYAGWTYAEQGVPEVGSDKGIQLETYENTLQKGHYTFTQNEINSGKGLFYFDSAATVGKTELDKNAVVFVNNCEFVVTFTPNENATPDVLANGVDTELHIYNTAKDRTVDLGSGPVAIYSSYADIIINIQGVSGEGYHWTKNDDGSFTFTLSQSDLQALFDSHMVLNSANLVLSSSALHSAFDTATEGMTMKTHVKDLATVPANPDNN